MAVSICWARPLNAQHTALEACWNANDLAKKPGEQRIRRKSHPYSPPDSNPSLAEFKTVPPGLRGAVRRVTLSSGKKWIALTLDLCEQVGEVAGYDGAIFDYLRSENIAVTVFAGGKWMRTHPDRTMQLMADPNFVLANHGEAHRNLRLLSRENLTREIVGPQAAYETLRTKLHAKACFKTTANTLVDIPQRLRHFRFPYGACNPAALGAVNDAGLIAIQWDHSSWDSSPAQSARKIARRMTREVRPGSIILAHANGRGHHTAAALRLAIPTLRQRGFKFVSISTLLAAGDPVIEQRCYNVRPGDTNHYGLRTKRHGRQRHGSKRHRSKPRPRGSHSP